MVAAAAMGKITDPRKYIDYSMAYEPFIIKSSGVPLPIEMWIQTK